MIKDSKTLRKFEDKIIREEKLSYNEALEIFESLWQEAVSLNVLPLKDPMEGIDDKIKLAKILNSCSKDSLKK